METTIFENFHEFWENSLFKTLILIKKYGKPDGLMKIFKNSKRI